MANAPEAAACDILIEIQVSGSQSADEDENTI